MLNKLCIVRDNMAGVFVGTLTAYDLAAGTWEMVNARKIHYWVKAAAVEGLAAVGDGAGGRITPKVGRVAGRALVQIVEDTGGCQSLMDYPGWTP